MKRYEKTIRRARQRIASACTGVQTLEVITPHAGWFGKLFSWDTESIIDALYEIDCAIVHAVQPVRTVMIMEGLRVELGSKEVAPILQAATSLHWEIRREKRKYSSAVGNRKWNSVVSSIDVERNFDVGKYNEDGEPRT